MPTHQLYSTIQIHQAAHFTIYPFVSQFVGISDNMQSAIKGKASL